MSSAFGRRLRQARELAGLSQQELCRRVGIAQSTLAAAESRGEGSRKTTQLALALNVDPQWLATGEGEMRPRDSVISRIAHTSPLYAYTVPPTKTREEIVSGLDLGSEFRYSLSDDALAPGHPRGTDIVWSTEKRPAIGSLVLVVDPHQQLHARQYAQGIAPGKWVAAATHQAYASFDGDGLRLVAVAKYRELP